MAYPGSVDLLGLVIQDSDGAQADGYNVPASPPYTHHLGTDLSPTPPAAWQYVPKGAFPIDAPAAPTSGSPAGTTASGNFLTASGHYKWALSNVTAFGETVPGSALDVANVGTYKGYNLVLPAVAEGTATNPVLKRRLYRTADGGSTFYLVAEIADLGVLAWVDGLPDANLATLAPSSDTSGSVGTVTLVIDGAPATEVASSPAAGEFSVDYGLSPTGGVITHAAADSGLAVVATYTAATLVTSAVLGDLVAALRDARSAFGVPGAASGTAQLNASGYLAQALAKGVRQIVTYQPSSDLTTDSSHQSVPSTTYGNWGHLRDVAITTVAGSSVLALSLGNAWNYHATSGNWWRCALALDGAGVQEGNYVANAAPTSAQTAPSVAVGVWAGVAAGAHNVNVLGSSGGGAGLNPAGGYKSPTSATDSQLTVIIVEFA